VSAGSPGDDAFGQALEHAHGVEGWMTDAQAQRLWRAARSVATGQIVEIGSFRGRSTVILARAAEPGTRVIAIDPHGGGDRGPQEIFPDAIRGDTDFDRFHANLRAAGVDDRVRHVRRPSSQALSEVDGPLALLYVDGAHRYRPALDDLRRWGERVAPGGTMLIHDSFNAAGVMLAQLRLLVASSRWRYVGRSGSLAEYERVSLGASERALNAARQLASLPYFARNMAIKVLIVARLTPLTRLLGHGDEPWPY